MRSLTLLRVFAPLFLGAFALASAKPPAAAPLAASPSFSVTGDWRGGSLPGHKPGSSTLYCTAPDASATWRPALHSICPVRISFWIPAHASNTRNALLEVNPGGTDRGVDKGRALKAYPDWFLNNQPRPSSGRVGFVNWFYHRADTPLVPSGLVGPVRLVPVAETALAP
jgi:hypothetical protein